ncbi:MAG: Polyphosphate:AMP phosphotransferase [Pedosphaera sp.]|nr:Polyphosphate:AMP phosphotransferase [Pedosphaera sp.]
MATAQPIKITSRIRLRDFDPCYHGGLDKETTEQETVKLCLRIGDLQQLLYANASHSLTILLQGMDTSGKDGAVKRVLEFVNPLGVEATSFKVPSAEEAAHDFLWRIHKAEPRLGNFGVFNRSQYEDVLVVRVLKLKPKAVWEARYDEINAFEKTLAENNHILLKFFLHISKDEQARRLKARLRDPAKNWKIDPEDFRMRRHWNEFQKAYADAINRCTTSYAPWHIVPANHKWYRNYVIAQTVVHAIERLKMKWPKPKVDVSKIKPG